MNWFAFTQAYAAMLAFSLSMPVHHRAVFLLSPVSDHPVRWRIVGTVLGVGSLACAVVALDWQIGTMLWIAMLAVSGIMLTQFLAFAPRWALAPAVALLLAGAVAVSL